MPFEGKRLIRTILGFQSMKTARATITEFEVMRMFKKGQFRFWIEAVGAKTEVSWSASLVFERGLIS